jgi:hypothetical protein
MLPFVGAVTFSTPEPAVNGTSIARWPMFTECVTEAGFISITLLMLAAFGVVTWKAWFHPTAAGAVVIVGRAPLNRYGGL